MEVAMLDDDSLARDAERHYEMAMESAHHLAQEWEKEGRPTTYTRKNGSKALDPLLKAYLQSLEVAARLRRDLKRRPRGRPPVAVLMPDEPDLDDVL
jgi:hypothetical protein